MSNIFLEEVPGRKGQLTNERYGEYIFTLQAQELAVSYVTFLLEAYTAVPVVMVQGSYDGGQTWEALPNINVPNITGAGRYFIDITTEMHVPSLYRLIIRPPVGETCTVASVRKLRTTEYAQVRTNTSILNAWCDTINVANNAPVAYTQPVTQSDATVGVMVAWNGTQHRELLLDTEGNLRTRVLHTTPFYAYRRVYAINPLTAADTVALPARTRVSKADIFDSSGYTYLMELLDGATVTATFFIPPGGTVTSLDVYATDFRVTPVGQSLTAGEMVLSLSTFV